MRSWMGWIGLSMWMVGCSGGGAGRTTVTLQMANETASSRAVNQAPTVFGVKLIAVYLSEDISDEMGDNIGETPMIYLNPTCEPDLSHCDVSGGTSSEDGGEMTYVVEDYFDFARPTAEVNEQLQAQGRSVQPGTYRYVRAEFCKYNEEDAPTIRWAVDGMTPSEYERCGVNQTQFDEPMVVSAGDSVVVTLAYDLSEIVQVGEDAVGEDCVGSGSETTCVSSPELVPLAERVEGEDTGE